MTFAKDLQQAFADYDAGKIQQDDLIRAQDKATEDSLSNMAKTGEILITDGEQRASSFATYPIIDTPGGKGFASMLAADGQYFAIFVDGHHRQHPRLISDPLKYKTYAYDNFKKSMPFAHCHAMKQAVIAPSTLHLLYPLKRTMEGYPKGEFLEDLVNEVNKPSVVCTQTMVSLTRRSV